MLSCHYVVIAMLLFINAGFIKKMGIVLRSHCRWQSWPFPIFQTDSFVRAKRLCSRKYAEMRTMFHLVAGKKDQFLGLAREKVSRLIEKANMKRVMIDREHIRVFTSCGLTSRKDFTRCYIL